MKSQAIIFLGNPGREYEKTRHNCGWMVSEYLKSQLAYSEKWVDKFEGKLIVCGTGLDKFYLFKPQAFMNLSGSAVRKLCDFYKISPEAIIVVHDEIELSFGQLAFKQGGGAGGHNGIRSIDTALGTQNYLRCRVGIGRPHHGGVSAFVLSRFTADEEIVLPLILEAASKELIQIIQGAPVLQQKIQAVQAIV